MKATPPNASPPRLSRRRFLNQAGTLAAGSLVTQCICTCALPAAAAATQTGAAPRQPLVGSQLYGWGQYYDRAGKKLHEHMDEALSALKDCGYDYAEGSVDWRTPDNNRRFADQLRAHRLRPVSLYTGGGFHETDTADQTVRRLLELARVCKDAGFAILNCNPDPIGREKTDAELATQVGALTSLGRGLRELSLRLGIHHHTPAMRNQAREFHYNFRRSTAKTVGFCFDVHWVYRGGLDPMTALREYGDRVVSWHLRQSRAGTWWETLDSGDIDYARIAAYAREHDLAPFYTVELALEQETKITRSVVENHRLSREFVRDTFSA